MYRYNCLLIDLDDTLLDFTGGHHEALEETLLHFNIPVTEDTLSRYERINGALWRSYEKKEIKKDRLVVVRWSMLLSQLGLEGDPAAINEYYFARLSQAGIPIRGVHAVLEALAEGATVAVITNGTASVQAGRIQVSGIAPYLDEVINSEEAGAAKPAKRFFDYTMDRLGVSRRDKVLVVGDSLTSDIAGGAGAGFDTCWYNPQEQENTGKVQPTYIVKDYDELMQIVMGEDYEAYANEHDRI